MSLLDEIRETDEIAIIVRLKMFAMPVKCNYLRLLRLVKYWKKNIRKSTSSLGNGALNNS